MNLLDRSKVWALSVSLRCTARKISQFCNSLLYVDATRWSWWTPTRISGYFPLPHSNLSETFRRPSLIRSDHVFLTRIFGTRSSSLELPSPPSAVFPTPDGSCLLVLHSEDSQPSLTAYHWDTFGSTDGIRLEFPKFSLDGALVTSILNRKRVFLLALDVFTQCVGSVAIDISGKVAEVAFQDSESANGSNNDPPITVATEHNILLDCHKEVWTQFPVIPAVKGRTVTSTIERQPRSLTFITENHTQPFASHFSNLIQGFVRTTRKSTGNELRGIKVSATDFVSFRDETIIDPNWTITRYRVGEWLVDLLCFVPIQIAVCRENRFIPLANGINSPELERSLLGADVNQIVDNLSFGWYEPIFKSYMATKVLSQVSICYVFSSLMCLCVARKSCVVDGPAVRGEKLCVEPPRGFVLCG